MPRNITESVWSFLAWSLGRTSGCRGRCDGSTESVLHPQSRSPLVLHRPQICSSISLGLATDLHCCSGNCSSC